ncbi:MAG: hypothetical protein BAA04_05400 [Firmicutes bacterium ZCTH02-B6]|nr:MAG: hypothetical protein BAA04_05400 [Firmicutes bacterium ZCTH02-B6]
MESRIGHQLAGAGTATSTEAGLWDELPLEAEDNLERPVEEPFPRYVCWLCTGVFGSEGALRRHLKEHGLL